MDVTILKIDPKKRFSDIERYLPFVSAERQQRIERLKPERSKVISLMSGMLLSAVLSERCGVFPNELRYSYGEHGKPFLEGHPECCFSLSHSGELIALACGDSAVGIDVQKIDREKKHPMRFLHQNERKSILAAEDKAEEFCRIWTMNEAFVKLTGEGLSRGFNSFDVLSMEECEFRTQLIGEYMLTICTNNFTSEPKIHTITENELIDRLFY